MKTKKMTDVKVGSAKSYGALRTSLQNRKLSLKTVAYERGSIGDRTAQKKNIIIDTMKQA